MPDTSTMKNHLWIWALFYFLISCTVTPTKRHSSINFKKEFQTIRIDHKYFKVLYSKEHRLPVWVEYTVTKSDLKGPGKRRNNFHPDKKLIQMDIPPVIKKDIPGKLFDKGHMAPAADFKRSQEAMDTTFVMSNIAPQTANLNRGAWRALESRVHKWICGEEKLTIITGPILTGTLKKLDAGITIPKRFFKVVYDETPPLKSIAFVYSQEDSGDPYLERIESLDTVEKMAEVRLPKAISTYPEVKDITSWKSSSKCK